MNFNAIYQKNKVKHLFLSLSGGLDSTVLAQACLSLRAQLPPLHFIHLNFQLRKPDCFEEETFLAEWASREQLKFHVKRCEAPKNLKNIQAWARQQRLKFFIAMLEEFPQTLFVLAHHQKDQVETFLLRLIRGGDWKSLGGMKMLESFTSFEGKSLTQPLSIFRPLLEVPKESLERYAQSHRLVWKEDLSNQKTDYLRNRIRLKLLPELLRENNQIINSIFDVSQDLQVLGDDYEKKVKRWLQRYQNPELRSLPLTAFLKLNALEQSLALKIFLNQVGAVPAAFQEWVNRFLASLSASRAKKQIIPLKKSWFLSVDPSKILLRREKSPLLTKMKN